MKIGILGGTGDLGEALAIRLALAGEKVFIGSRTAEKAIAKAAEYNRKLAEAGKLAELISGVTNEKAAEYSDIVILTMPYNEDIFAFVGGLKEHLKNKIVVSAVVPMEQSKGVFYHKTATVIPSATIELTLTALAESRVVAAFQTVPAKRFADINDKLGWHVPVCGNDEEAKKIIMDLINRLDDGSGTKLRALDAGSLYNARLIEMLTPFLINLKIKNKLKTELGIRFC